MAQQYIRYASLIVADDSGNGLELRDLAIKFVVHHGTYTYPHTLNARVYNLAPTTLKRLETEFTRVVLVAGYRENYGLIFSGTIKQLRKGRENQTETFVDIFAADGDLWHNYGIINQTLSAGHTQGEVWQAIGGSLRPYNATAPIDDKSTPINSGKACRGKVMFGPIRDTVRDFAYTNGVMVTTDNGIVKAMGLFAYKPGDAIEINSATGMVGVPEQTEQGITVTTLLNPAISWGTRIKINNADLTQNVRSSFTDFDRQVGIGITPPRFPDISADGFYKVLAVDHIGETRGNPWYSELICIALDPTANSFTPGVKALNLGLGGLDTVGDIPNVPTGGG